MNADCIQRALRLCGSVAAGLLFVAGAGWVRGEEASAEGIEFFEKRVRPVLVERCYKCHSAQSEKLKGELRLDSREGLLKGGEQGAAIDLAHLEKSRFIEAITYENIDLQMPPKGKLPEREIADLVTWIKMGAPWPAEPKAVGQVARKEDFSIEKRRQSHWAWQPIRPQTPPAPALKDWARTPVDQFVLAKLEASGLKPAASADKRTLIRRLHFDLTGLPPAPEVVEQFVNDSSPGAYERLVDALLASPHFGERWARHWLDLVRYAETLGHEFDYPMHNAWRYRDYLIRAFNADVPYDQFVREHVAGDTLASPRRHPVEGFNESIIGTAFYWLGQQTHSPVDVRMNQAEVIENQIDVLAKTFLGLTLSCARCHDHKFDAMSMRDYYGIYGMISSSRYAQASIDPAEKIEAKLQQLAALKPKLRAALGEVWQENASQISNYLLAAHALVSSGPGRLPGAIAAEHGVDVALLDRWLKALKPRQPAQTAHPLFAWTRMSEAAARGGDAGLAKEWESLRTKSRQTLDNAAADESCFVFADFQKGVSPGWQADGEAFDHGLSEPGEFGIAETNTAASFVLAEPVVHSAALSRRAQGALRSPTFTITNQFLHLRVAGRDSRINVFVDNFVMIQDPIYGGLRRVLNDDSFHWITVDLSMWQGHRAYIEFSDIPTADPAAGGRQEGYGTKGWIAVQRAVFSNDRTPPPAPAPDFMALLNADEANTLAALAGRYAQAAQASTRLWANDSTLNRKGLPEKNRAALALLDWLARNELLDADVAAPLPHRVELARLLREYRDIESAIPNPARVPALVEGDGLDEFVFLRGNPKTPGEGAPRRFLEAIHGAQQPLIARGSGRRELADRILDPSNPLPARVMANRVWHHLFGRGLVPTPDDFGALGQPPSHPELLDWLARWFAQDAEWSTKKLIRLLVTSSVYRMSSAATEASAEEKDPNNVFLHRMNVRRLEGEAIRDAILTLSGRLDREMFGPPVAAHLTEFMDGRGRPNRSGPLDGAGRRSLYLEARRNFLNPMMRAFDAPVPMTTVGRRTQSNVPAQSLILMNDPFVIAEAERWAEKALAVAPSAPDQRVDVLYRAALSRPASSGEIAAALAFLDQQRESYQKAQGKAPDERLLWADLCHVLLNTKEFVFVN